MSIDNTQFYKHPISVDEMWSLTNREEKNWGIEGYEIHKNYFDYKKTVKDKERDALNEKVWSRRAHYPKPAVKLDKEGKPIVVKRPNYLDEVIKIANSFFSKEKNEKLTEELKDKSLKPYEKKKKEDVKRAPRVLFTDWMIKNEKKKNEPNKEKDLTAILEKIKNHDKQRQILPMDKMKADYQSKRRGTSMCDKVNMTSEAVFLGEQIPFYQTAPLKDGAPELFEDVPGAPFKEIKEQARAHNKLKKNKVLFFPRKYFTSAWQKAPSWVYPQKSKKSDKCDYTKIENELKEKKEKVMEKVKAIKARLEIDVPQSWFEVHYRKRLYLTFAQPAKKAEWYPEWRKNNPLKSPGPQQYWKRYAVKYVAGKTKPDVHKPSNEEGKEKQYFLEEKFTGKKYYKPMKGHIF